MFLLSSHPKLDSIPALHEELAASLASMFGLRDIDRRITLGGHWPRLSHLEIDLTGARVDPFQPPPTPAAFAAPPTEGPLRADRFGLTAHPLHVGDSAQLRLKMAASGVDLVCRQDVQNQVWLVPQHLTSGQADITLAGHDLEHLFLQGAEQAAAMHGVTIQEGNLQLRQANPQEVLVEAELVAKKLFVQSHLRLRGRVAIDTHLNIHFKDLACSGHGLVGTLASQFLQPHLRAWQSKPLPLLAMALPGVKLHHAELITDAEGILHARAEFGGDQV